MADLSVNLGGLRLANPVLTASGTFGYGSEYSDFYDLARLGGIIVKGTTLEPRQGNPYPRMAETPSGMLNAVGLQNKGVEYFATAIYPEIKDCGTEVIVNVSGACVADYVATAERLATLEGIHAIELNISCPNVKQGGMAFGTSCAGASEVVSAVRKAWPRHLMVKLSPNVTSIADIALAVEAAGADSVSLINTLLGMAVDVERRRPVLSTVTGGLSGPAVRPVAVRMVWQVDKAVGIHLVGLGGSSCGRDALQL
ncbi:MAG: dihydroorotate dehydrogenase, partial [Muribaculaceae bacterium]|nr:dihydroorotate dehydrogenase [Muribaculaceae bacterium]